MRDPYVFEFVGDSFYTLIDIDKLIEIENHKDFPEDRHVIVDKIDGHYYWNNYLIFRKMIDIDGKKPWDPNDVNIIK